MQNHSAGQQDLHPESDQDQLAHDVDKIIQHNAPIHMINYDSDSKKYLVTAEAREYLARIKQRVGVIAVAGKYRTGKSFLLNRVIINQKHGGFGVGPTINPCTKGLWLWPQLLETTYQGQPLKLLIVDSEGIGAFDEDETHDTKIFLLALLLSSFFIYNSMGTIDENALNNLSLIINLSKELQVKSELLEDCDPEEISKLFPSFLWVVRDFALRLTDSYDNIITSKQYLENALQLQKGNSDSCEQKNRIRRLIKQVFSDRDCFTMVRPVETERGLQELQSMSDDQMRTEFVQQKVILREKIFRKVKPKVLNGKFVSGEMLLELADAYTQSINSGSVPNIQNAWTYVCQNECQRAIEDAVTDYRQQMKPVLEETKVSLDEQQLKRHSRHFKESSIFKFREKAFGQDLTIFEQQLRTKLSQEHLLIKQAFNRYCEQKAKVFLEPEINRVQKLLMDGHYQTIDEAVEDIDTIKKKFGSQGPQFGGATQILSEICTQLVVKAATYVGISVRQQTNLNYRKTQDRVVLLEEQIKSDRQDTDSKMQVMQRTIQQLESDQLDSVRNERLAQDRLQSLQRQFDEQQSKHASQLSQLKSDYVAQLQMYELEISQLKKEKNQIELMSVKSNSEFEKLNALIEQKLGLTEQQVQELKSKVQSKDAQIKELQKQCLDLVKLQDKRDSESMQLRHSYIKPVQPPSSHNHMIDNAIGFQCQYCFMLISKQQFSQHLTQCVDKLRIVVIMQTVQTVTFQVQENGKQKILQKTVKECQEFVDIHKMDMDITDSIAFIKEICLITAVRESHQFRVFFELCEDEVDLPGHVRTQSMILRQFSNEAKKNRYGTDINDSE